jgi:hypothetical protein
VSEGLRRAVAGAERFSRRLRVVAEERVVDVGEIEAGLVLIARRIGVDVASGVVHTCATG